MIAGVRDALKRKLKTQTFLRASYWWWWGKHYLPRRVTSVVVRRAPVLFGEPSDLLEGLRGVNLFAPTAMCRIMTRYGSDKGNSWHNYTAIYSHLFEEHRERVRRIFELGICRIDQESASSTGSDGRPGASLRGWRETFPHAKVFGADIDRSILFSEDRIQTYYCDQLDSGAIRDLWAQPELRDEMDIIIEDGLHTFPANVSFLAGSLDHICVGGTYVVEDIARKDLPLWHKQLPIYVEEFPGFDFVLAELPNALNSHDNNMLIIRRRS